MLTALIGPPQWRPSLERLTEIDELVLEKTSETASQTPWRRS